MHSFNLALEQALVVSEGNYLEPEALDRLQRYHQTYRVRLATYEYLRDHGDCLVMRSLRNLQMLHPEAHNHLSHCGSDMSAVLGTLAASLLRDDEAGFHTHFVLWFSTVMAAHKRTLPLSISSYRILKQQVTRSLPTNGANLVRPYLEGLIQSLQAHASFTSTAVVLSPPSRAPQVSSPPLSGRSVLAPERTLESAPAALGNSPVASISPQLRAPEPPHPAPPPASLSVSWAQRPETSRAEPGRVEPARAEPGRPVLSALSQPRLVNPAEQFTKPIPQASMGAATMGAATMGAATMGAAAQTSSLLSAAQQQRGPSGVGPLGAVKGMANGKILPAAQVNSRVPPPAGSKPNLRASPQEVPGYLPSKASLKAPLNSPASPQPNLQPNALQTRMQERADQERRMQERRLSPRDADATSRDAGIREHRVGLPKMPPGPRET